MRSDKEIPQVEYRGADARLAKGEEAEFTGGTKDGNHNDFRPFFRINTLSLAAFCGGIRQNQIPPQHLLNLC